MTFGMMCYLNLLAASIVELGVTGIILAHMIFGSAAKRLPLRSRWMFRFAQIGFTGTAIFILMQAKATWPPYFSILLATLVWFSFWNQLAVFDFHIRTQLWRKPNAAANNI